MKHSVEQELKQHIIDKINDGVLTDDNVDDWHQHAFNDDYYIIGYYNAEQWLKQHDISAFEAIGICQDYERDHFGECHKTYDDAETTVNMLTYVWGDELLAGTDSETIEDLRKYCE